MPLPPILLAKYKGNSDIFIETGTFQGHGVAAALLCESGLCPISF